MRRPDLNDRFQVVAEWSARQSARSPAKEPEAKQDGTPNYKREPFATHSGKTLVPRVFPASTDSRQLHYNSIRIFWLDRRTESVELEWEGLSGVMQCPDRFTPTKTMCLCESLCARLFLGLGGFETTKLPPGGMHQGCV